MNERSEALAQLSRILGDDNLRSATLDQAREAVRSKQSQLVDGLVIEAAQSDDVFDLDSGLAYVDQRLEAFGELIASNLRQGLLEDARDQIEKW